MENQITAKLTECLERCRTLIDNGEAPEIARCIDDSLARLNLPMQLAIIGKISSSKSTLVNAILGKAEVVRTGKMEETFNVSWLKYGSENDDVEVTFKDGHKEMIPRHEWAIWSSREGENTFRENVKFITVTYPHEILKKINIIDTPGLSADSKIDSQNTIDFLKEVRPDAVLLLFPKSIDKDSLSVLNDFQNSEVASKFSLSPLNAIGILAKPDTLWAASHSDINPIKEGKRIVEALYHDYPQLKSSLFSIYPVSALLGLASSAIGIEEQNALASLSEVNDQTLMKMLSAPVFLTMNYPDVHVSADQRKNLYAKLGNYGIYAAIRHIKSTPHWSLRSLTDSLQNESGLSAFSRTLFSHFGDRAALIKSQNSIKRVIDSCESMCNSRTNFNIAKLQQVQERLIGELLSIHEYEEWDNLSKIYSGELTSHIPQALDEYKRICGENGASLCERLNVSKETPKTIMRQTVESRINYWTRKYNIERQRNPKEVRVYKMILRSYRALLEKTDQMTKEEARARQTLTIANHFFYGQID